MPVGIPVMMMLVQVQVQRGQILHQRIDSLPAYPGTIKIQRLKLFTFKQVP